MKILYIYRHPDMGFSIGKVFRPIEEKMKKYAEVDSIYLPVANYSLKGFWKNIRYAQKASLTKKYDIIHITGSEHYLIPFLRKQKVVVTVHDLGFFTIIKKNFISKFFKKILFINTLAYADKVTFISEKSEKESRELVRIKSEKCVVIHNPVGEEFVYSQHTFNENCPTILHIGTLPRKNLVNTIYALRDISCKFVIVGKLREEQLLALKETQTSYINKKGLTDKEIVEEYLNCDIVNFPSLYEGFGMPILEGQATGRVVITSNCSPMKEVAGHGAVLVNPTSVVSIREEYKKVIENFDFRNEVVKQGTINVANYRLENIVNCYLKVYNSLGV